LKASNQVQEQGLTKPGIDRQHAAKAGARARVDVDIGGDAGNSEARLPPADAPGAAALPATDAHDYNALLVDAIFAVRPDSTCVHVAGACERIFGYTCEEMVGKKMLDLVHPDDRGRTVDSISRVMNGYLQSYFENRYIRKDGQVVCISWSASWSEERQLRIGVARDITRRTVDEGVLLASQLLPEKRPCWQLSASPRRLIAPDLVSIPLSAQDHTVLHTLMSGGDCISRKLIVEALGENFLEYDQRRLDTQMRRLRRKVREASTHALPVSTLRAVGYRFYDKATIES
jgi:PAS domain S-box-containing protein